MTNYWLYYTVLVLILTAEIQSKDRFYDYLPLLPSYIDEDTPLKFKVIRTKSGNNATLKCDAPKCHNGGALPVDTISWKFSDRVIPMKKKCITHLELRNVTSSDSGVYTCSVNNIAKISYKLEVSERGKPPTILEIIPSQSTVLQYANIIVQCLAKSPQAPSIFWFKETDHQPNTDNSRDHHSSQPTLATADQHAGIWYMDKYYLRMNTSTVVLRTRTHHYLSKLHLTNATLADNGTYACVAITANGRGLKFFDVRVLKTGTVYEYDGGYRTVVNEKLLIDDGNVMVEQSVSLSVLFLIPVPFVLIPSVVWLCYYRKRGRKTTTVEGGRLDGDGGELDAQQESILLR